jgi:hypothetical protein
MNTGKEQPDEIKQNKEERNDGTVFKHLCLLIEEQLIKNKIQVN